MKWVKWRSGHSSGYSKWKYMPLYVDKATKDIEESVEYEMQEKAEEYSWSEHFRGIDWEIIDHKKVPNIKIEEIHKNLLDSVEDLKRSIKVKEENSILIKKLFGKGSKTDPDEIAYAKHRKKIDAQLKRLEKERQAEYEKSKSNKSLRTICKCCDGKGWKNNKFNITTCPVCNGEGTVSLIVNGL
jgi:rubrerythrin